MTLKEVLDTTEENQSILLFSGAIFTWAGEKRQFKEPQYYDRTVYHVKAENNVLILTIA